MEDCIIFLGYFFFKDSRNVLSIFNMLHVTLLLILGLEVLVIGHRSLNIIRKCGYFSLSAYLFQITSLLLLYLLNK